MSESLKTFPVFVGKFLGLVSFMAAYLRMPVTVFCERLLPVIWLPSPVISPPPLLDYFFWMMFWSIFS